MRQAEFGNGMAQLSLSPPDRGLRLLSGSRGRVFSIWMSKGEHRRCHKWISQQPSRWSRHDKASQHLSTAAVMEKSRPRLRTPPRGWNSLRPLIGVVCAASDTVMALHPCRLTTRWSIIHHQRADVQRRLYLYKLSAGWNPLR